MVTPEQAEFERLAAAIDAANARREPVPERVRRRANVLWDLTFDDPAPPAQTNKDWRTDHVITPVQQQGPCGSCASFAAAAAIEAQLRIKNPHDATIVNAGFLHTCIVQGGQDDCNAAADLGPALHYIQAAGYAAVTGPTPYPYPTDRCANVPLHPMTAYRPLNGPNAVKNALMAAPVVAEIYPDQGFTHFQGQGVYRSPTPLNGWYAHSLCIIGFNDQGWLVKNSYGSQWGSGGFAVIAYQTCGLFGPPVAGSDGQAFAIILP